MTWLYAPSDRGALCDVAKLAAALRSGEIPGPFLDGEAAGVTLGAVGRVTLLAPVDLGLPPSPRRFVLARGTFRLCLAEVMTDGADLVAAAALLEALATLRAREPEREVVGWLLAPRVSDEARAALARGGAVATSTERS
ncbi:MAG: hypothetical protein EXR72_18225 [Myxococcales bacterium]|nr:hypothetical protein [Myxococcales bacterium]